MIWQNTQPRFPRQVFSWQVLLARVYSIIWQVFPWQGALFKSCMVMPAFEQGKLSRKNLSKKNLYTRANKTSQAKPAKKTTCSLYTRASKATKELVKENLDVCAGLNCIETRKMFSINYLRFKHFIHLTI